MRYILTINRRTIAETDSIDIAEIAYRHERKILQRDDSLELYDSEKKKEIYRCRQWFVNIPIYIRHNKEVVWCLDIADSMEEALKILAPLNPKRYKYKDFGGGIYFPNFHSTHMHSLEFELDRILYNKKEIDKKDSIKTKIKSITGFELSDTQIEKISSIIKINQI